MNKPFGQQKIDSEPTQEQLDAFIKRAGFSYGWQNLESWARRMAEYAVSELNKATLKNQASTTQDAGDPAREILKNLARRLRMAKKQEARTSGTPVAMMSEGARLEAWNSFQAAKAIYNNPEIEQDLESTQQQAAQQAPSETHMRTLWAKHAAKEHGWPSEAVPPMHDLGNGPRFETGWHESEYAVFRAGFIAAHRAEPAFQQETNTTEGSAMQISSKKTIEQKTSEADAAFEDYDFGEDDCVVHHDGWDTSDPKDLIKVVYMQFDGYPSDESEKVSFHVRFDENDKIEEVYALECRHGTEIGSYPKQQTNNKPGMGM